MKNLSEISAPLYEILKNTQGGKCKFYWDQKCDSAFDKIKDLISRDAMLRMPNLNSKFILTTDASDIAIGSVLSQLRNGIEEPIYYFSKTLNDTQRKYSATDKELLAVMRSIEQFRPYLVGKKFLLRTDHKAITYLFKTKNLSSRLLRWSLELQEYSFDIEYIKGRLNVSDALSRLVNNSAVNYVTNIIEKENLEEKEFKLIRNRKLKILKGEDIGRILNFYHIKTGHGSERNMKHNICKKYWWLGINKQINKFVKECLIYTKAKEFRKNKKIISIKSKNALEMWEIDVFGPLPQTKSGNKYILSILDHYTRWAYTFPMNNKSSNNVVCCLKKAFEIENDVPQKILTDNGLEFANNEFERLLINKGVLFSERLSLPSSDNRSCRAF
jgi:hypothetical protein